MDRSDYLLVIESHPGKVEVSYKGTSTSGVLDQTPTEVFDNGIRRIYDKKCYYVAGSLPAINKKETPGILIDGVLNTITDHYPESPFISVVILK